MSAYVPSLVHWVKPWSYTIQKDDRPTTMARKFGMPPIAYGQLVGANLERPLSLAGIPDGCAATFDVRGFREGDHLRIPGWWPDPPMEQSRGAGLGMLGQASIPNVDALWKTFQDNLPKLQQTGALPAQIPAEWVPAILNAASIWWRTDKPPAPTAGGAGATYPMPTIADVTKYLGAAVDFAKTAAQWNPTAAQVMAHFPWQMVPFTAIDWSKFTQWAPKIDWNGLCQQLIPTSQPGSISNELHTVHFVDQDWSKNLPGSTIPWAILPWSSPYFSSICWDLLPWKYISAETMIQAAGAGGASLASVLAIVKTAITTQQMGANPPAPPPAGMVCPPGYYWDGKQCLLLKAPHIGPQTGTFPGPGGTTPGGTTPGGTTPGGTTPGGTTTLAKSDSGTPTWVWVGGGLVLLAGAVFAGMQLSKPSRRKAA